MVDPATGRPLFATRGIELACEACKENGKAHECVHMLHLVPSWQSAERHRKLKIMVRGAATGTTRRRLHVADLGRRVYGLLNVHAQVALGPVETAALEVGVEHVGVRLRVF